MLCVLVVAHASAASNNNGSLSLLHYDVPEVGLTLTFPQGWAPVPTSTLNSLIAEIHKRAPNATPHYLAGYQLVEHQMDPGLTFPYVLVQENLSRPPTPSELRAAAEKLSSSDAAGELTRRAGGALTFEGAQMSYDAASNSVYGTMIVSIDGNKAAVFTRMLASSRGTVGINGYFADPDRATATALFRPMFSGARIVVAPPAALAQMHGGVSTESIGRGSVLVSE